MRVSASLRFDWLMAVLGALLMAGVIQDGWAHNHGLVDQSFFTPWHAILYGMMGLSGVVLGALAIRNVMRGSSVRAALPYGYWMSLCGVIIFAIGGVLDLLWHVRFGIETDINALISPTHLWLAIGGAMVFAGPLVSVASRFAADSGGWKIAGPAILSCLSLMTLLGFFTAYAQPMGDDAVAFVMRRHAVSGNEGALYAVRNGTAESRLLRIRGADIWGASVSPDGARVAFRVARAPSPVSQIWIANSDGTKPAALTNSGRHDTQPAWSPEGKHIAYISMPAGTSGEFQLNIVDAASKSVHTVLHATTLMQFPAWSPDGKHIVFQSRNGLVQQLAVVSAGGGVPKWLASTAGGSQPAWAPSKTIAFADDGGISTTGLTDKTSTRLIKGAAQMPSWNHSASQIAFVWQPNDGRESQIYVANANGSAMHDVSDLSGLNASRPSWSANRVVFFTATGRPAVAETGMGKAYSEDANIIEALVVTGFILLPLRRWRLPFGAVTLMLGLFAIAMATQSDLYFSIPGAIIVGLFADFAILLYGDRIRSGLPFYAFSFLIPFLLFLSYLISVSLNFHGLAWPPNMIFGSPFIAGFVGLIVAFCYAAPLRMGAQAGT